MAVHRFSILDVTRSWCVSMWCHVALLYVFFFFFFYSSFVFFFFQAEDAIRVLVRSRGLGDVNKSQGLGSAAALALLALQPAAAVPAVALVVALAMGVQFLVHVPALLVTARPGRDPLPSDAPVGRPSRAPWQRVLSLSLPLFAYVSLSQITTLVERVFASHLGAGAVARLTLAQKLSSLPLFLVAGSLAVVIFPRLAALQVDGAAFRAALAAGLRSALPLLLISTVWLISGSQLLVALLYQHGRFSAQDSALTAGLLQGYALGLAPAGLGAILLKALHARQDVRSPLAVAAVSLVCYLALAAPGSYKHLTVATSGLV